MQDSSVHQYRFQIEVVLFDVAFSLVIPTLVVVQKHRSFDQRDGQEQVTRGGIEFEYRGLQSDSMRLIHRVCWRLVICYSNRDSSWLLLRMLFKDLLARSQYQKINEMHTNHGIVLSNAQSFFHTLQLAFVLLASAVKW